MGNIGKIAFVDVFAQSLSFSVVGSAEKPRGWRSRAVIDG